MPEKSTPYEMHDNNKNLRFKGTKVDNKLEGKAEFFDDNGQLTMFFTYKNGKKEGPFTQYFPSGLKFIEGTYKDDRKDGPFIMFDEFGDKVREEPYTQGTLNGTVTAFFPKSGAIQQQGLYVKGKPQKVHKKFYETGQLFEEVEYDSENKGVPLTYPKRYKKDGSPL